MDIVSYCQMKTRNLATKNRMEKDSVCTGSLNTIRFAVGEKRNGWIMNISVLYGNTWMTIIAGKSAMQT